MCIYIYLLCIYLIYTCIFIYIYIYIYIYMHIGKKKLTLNTINLATEGYKDSLKSIQA